MLYLQLISIFYLPTLLDPEEKINFNRRISLCCDESWVHHPSHLELMHQLRSFTIKVDPTALSEGAHYTEVNICTSVVHTYSMYEYSMYEYPCTSTHVRVPNVRDNLLTQASCVYFYLHLNYSLLYIYFL